MLDAQMFLQAQFRRYKKNEWSWKPGYYMTWEYMVTNCPIVDMVYMFTSDVIILSGYHGYVFFVVALVSLASQFSYDHLDIIDCMKLKPRGRE
jgi:hypothetical protein